jgi:hypothetical protein
LHSDGLKEKTMAKDKGALEEDKKGKVERYTPDVPVEKEAESGKESFKKGGRMKKRKHGGHVDGKKAHHRLDKRAAGGRMGGHSPLSHAANVKGRPGAAYDGAVDKEDD